MQTLPRLLLHEHLDGGLRPATVADLAVDAGHRLPVDDRHLADWFDQGMSGSLERYLESFEQTVAVMQTRDALMRVAAESLEDLAGDGVVYVEVRFAPLLCTRGGLDGDDVLDAVITGFESVAGRLGIRWGIIVDAMRNDDGSVAVAELAVRHADRGVVGFDLAGPEAGFPPDLHLDAITVARRGGLGITIHAGEAAGVDSIARAVERCGAQRIGHGVEIIEDCRVQGGEIVDLGPIAAEVHSRRIPLEICPMSNLHTKRWTADQHPVGMLHRAGFAVTINTDNRLMSRTNMSTEFSLVAEHHGFGEGDVAAVTLTALRAAFCSDDVRQDIWDESLAPAWSPEGLTRPEPPET